MIKKLNVIAILALVICQIGCSSDDDASANNDNLTADQISGTWFMSDYSLMNGQQQTNTGDQVDTQFFREQGKDFNFRIAFNATTNKVESSGTYVVDTVFLSDTGETEGTSTNEISNLFNTFDWEIVDDFILLTRADGSTVTLRINVVETSRFVFTVDIGQILNLPEGVSASGPGRFTFGK